ncbi:MAG: lysine--tRNA ligase, partial [Actinomycetales bacterium]|nr:lysine--tRNA ligase [Actinomycetales bacterium]
MSETPETTETDDLPEQMQVRREKRQRLLDAGVDPYPISIGRTHSINEIVTSHDAEEL